MWYKFLTLPVHTIFGSFLNPDLGWGALCGAFFLSYFFQGYSQQRGFPSDLVAVAEGDGNSRASEGNGKRTSGSRQVNATRRNFGCS